MSRLSLSLLSSADQLSCAHCAVSTDCTGAKSDASYASAQSRPEIEWTCKLLRLNACRLRSTTAKGNVRTATYMTRADVRSASAPNVLQSTNATSTVCTASRRTRSDARCASVDRRARSAPVCSSMTATYISSLIAACRSRRTAGDSSKGTVESGGATAIAGRASVSKERSIAH